MGCDLLVGMLEKEINAYRDDLLRLNTDIMRQRIEVNSLKTRDPTKLSLEELMAISSPLSLADRIADANLQTLHREGPDHIDRLLSGFRSHVRRR